MPDATGADLLWTEPFLAALARHGNARQAAREANVSRGRATYRRSVDAAFAARWNEARAQARAVPLAPAPDETPVAGPPARKWRERFFETLAATSNIRASARAANVSENRVRKARRTDPKFAARWLAALHEGYDLLEMELLGYLRDRQPGWKMEVSAALRVLAGHRATVERRRLLNQEDDVDAIRESIDAFLEGMRERRLANEAILIEKHAESGGEHVAR